MGKVLTFKAPEVVDFEHRFFGSFPDANFRIDEGEGLPVYSFGLGQQQVALPFAGIKREFTLREYAHDAEMLNTIERGLRFVSLLRIGDSIPPEVLTGDASWEPSEIHKESARRRIGAQMVGWNTDQITPLSDPIGMEKFIAQHVNDISVKKALASMAIELGLEGDPDGIVAGVMADAGLELSYIEALRERYLAVRRVAERLQKLRREFAHRSNIMADVDPVSRLISIPIRSLGMNLIEVDARLASTKSLFSDFEFHRTAIRDIRDEMHTRLNPWDDIISNWSRLGGDIPDPYTVIPLLRDLYRFLAPRFMPADTWALILAKDNALDDRGNLGKVVTWYERDTA
ncbi:MAG: hypothetical protein HOL07_01810 [Rhodospirillaceae bacterium]|nr:hypothetical protein [Rhodospirillaceae bacterium]MBT3809721.1 hypothetical protein [Rhodospirillaceae bacterium]MBT3932346.1 hypothetical protein [Rhodospirillaceae bacterium]MBT4771209.1 hypothetical protein [Rhodospirillaceae bacterium]MBT5357053.1 hypothetical protein [Rhodospirillaceae bacterium]